jgi:hypothetical protein
MTPAYALHLEQLRARHDARELTADDLAALTDDELTVLALDEALYGRGRIDDVGPALEEEKRRRRLPAGHERRRGRRGWAA